MRDFLEQIQAALDVNLYYVALFGALAVPDICGALESEDGGATKAKYIEWFNRCVGPRYHGILGGADCYRFRCSMLHEFSTQHEKSKYSRIIFLEPGTSSNVFHQNVINDALNLDLRTFVRDVIDGARAWLNEVKDTEVYRKNAEKSVQRYPEGLEPYIVGTPVIG